MFNRPLHQRPFTMPRGVKMAQLASSPWANAYHTPGQNAAIRFFDPHSNADLQAMRDILKGKQVKKWMDDAHQISKTEYREWAGTESDTSFLFAVLDARVQTESEVGVVQGFVYLYSEREEKFRVRRMERNGFFRPTLRQRYALEVSFAVRPSSDGQQAGSGLMSSSVRQACLQVKMLLASSDEPEIELFGFVDQENLAAQRTMEASGFVKRGLMKYDADSEVESVVYILNWRVLQRKVRDKLLETMTSTPVRPEPVLPTSDAYDPNTTSPSSN